MNLDPELDSLIGIAASGRTPYVLGCLAYAKNLGCVTIGVACASPSSMEKSKTVDFMISPITGPEVVTGSTRLKAGTATKLVLNMLSTGTMIRTGKTYGNMVISSLFNGGRLIKLRLLDGRPFGVELETQTTITEYSSPSQPIL